MSRLKIRLEKIEAKIEPLDTVHYFGWADCTWSKSEGLTRLEDESKEDFCNRVYKVTTKNFLWFD
jgi:hypothetical protein